MKNLFFLFLFLAFSLFSKGQSNLEFTSYCGDTILCSNINCQNLYLYEFTADANTDCSVNSFITFSYAIDLDNNGFFDYSGSGNNISISPLTIGNHKIIFYASDQCGSSIECEQIVIVNSLVDDCIPPEIYCDTTILYKELLINGYLTLWIDDIHPNSPTDNCTPSNDIQLSFSQSGPIIGIPFSCNEYLASPDSIYEYEIWATDLSGNQSSCFRSFKLGHYQGVCNSLLFDSIPFCATTIFDETIPNITINNADSVKFYGDCYTAFYSDSYYSVYPLKTDDIMNGVTVLDIIALKRHVVGIELLDSPFQVIAGDQDGNGNVSFNELESIQNYRIARHATYLYTESWRFVEKNYVFPSVNEIGNAPHSILASSLDTLEFPYEFYGVKIGDANFSADPTGLTNGSDGPIIDTLTFCMPNISLEKNEWVTIPFTSKNFDDILGYQFTFEYDTTKISGVTILQEDLPNFQFANFDFAYLETGIFGTAWSELIPTGLTLDENTILYSLHFRPDEDCFLNEVFSISSAKTPAYGYSNEGVLAVDLEFCQIVSTEDIKQEVSFLKNVFPNPFSEKTTFVFELEKREDVVLEIFNLTGKKVMSIKKTSAQGENLIFIRKEDLSASGIYFYKLKTSRNYASGKIIVK